MYNNLEYQHYWQNQWYDALRGQWYYWNPYYSYWDTRNYNSYESIPLQDYGKGPLVIDIERAAVQNNNYRTALWTGKYFQVTLMSINVGGDIGLEVHPTTDQFIRIEEGQGYVQMGNSREVLDFQAVANEGYAVMVPAGKWHNITNIGQRPLKVYVIYAPPHHPFGTVHETKADAQQSE